MVPRGGPRCRQLRAAWRAVSSCWAPCPGMNHVTGPGRDAEQLFSSLKGECSELGHANSPPHFTGSNFPLSGDLWLKLVSVQEPRPPQRPSGSAGAPTGAAARAAPTPPAILASCPLREMQDGTLHPRPTGPGLASGGDTRRERDLRHLLCFPSFHATILVFSFGL